MGVDLLLSYLMIYTTHQIAISNHDVYSANWNAIPLDNMASAWPHHMIKNLLPFDNFVWEGVFASMSHLLS
jgi:hypothetical protein